MRVLTTMDKSNLVEVMDLNGKHNLSFYNGCVYGNPIPFDWGFSCKGNFLGLCTHIVTNANNMEFIHMNIHPRLIIYFYLTPSLILIHF